MDTSVPVPGLMKLSNQQPSVLG